jgi:hypothetical protein
MHLPDDAAVMGQSVEPFRRLQEVTVRITDGKAIQTGFWVDRSLIVTCAHGFAGSDPGDQMATEWGTELEPVEATVELVDMESDVMLLSVPDAIAHPLLPLSEDVVPHDALYGWGYTARQREGESLTTEVEGWSRAPYLLKTKGGLVDYGMSGAPLYSMRAGAIVAMVRISRDVIAPTGSRAILTATIKEICQIHDAECDPGLVKVHPDNLPTILGIFASAYASTRPIAPVDRALFGFDDLPELSEMQGALLDFEGHDSRREEAVREWYSVEPRCLRFVVLHEGERSRRVGATCVLPLKARSYQDYRAGRRREFDISGSDIASTDEDRVWLCFQSFAISHAGSSAAHRALRRSIFDHVIDVATASTLPRVIAEIGTDAGLVEARYFGMSYCGPSAMGRPLFELDTKQDETWRRVIAEAGG